LDPRTQINVIRGRSATDVWVAGAIGAIAHFDGTSWTRSDLGSQESIQALWIPESAEVALGTRHQVFARGTDIQDGGAQPSDGGWTQPPLSFDEPPSSTLLASAWAAPGAQWLWCAAKGAAQYTDGGLWRLRRGPSAGFEGRIGIPTDVCKAVGCTQMASIHGASANDLWAVGSDGATVRISDAESDTPSVKAFNSLTMNALNGVWAASAFDAWSVGASGTIRHYTGDPLLWEVVSDVPTSVDLNAVWGSSSSDVWAVGDAGVVLHYDGKTWSRVKTAGIDNRPKLTTVWGAGPGHVWIGGVGVILSLGGRP
jgi:hypothetical protein